MQLHRSALLALLALPVSALLSMFISQAAFAEATGNRYNLPRDYTSEVSAAEAYVLTNVEHEYKDRDDEDNTGTHDRHKTVIFDVRTIEEHVAGHPRKSYNIPFPHIQSRPNRADYIGQNPKDFFDYVAANFPDRDIPILTLCRTGYRSVLAANILANPSAWVPEYAAMDIAGYTNVRNIWEGFIGNTKTLTDLDGNTFEMDVNNDGLITVADRDGWANYQGLPYSLKLKKKRLYRPYLDLYFQ